MSSSPPPPSPPPESATASLGAAAEQNLVVTSDEVVSSVVVSILGGLLFLALWALLRRPLRRVFLKRTQLTDVPARPPPLGMRGLLNRCFDYLGPVFQMTDGEFVLTAGLDGLIMLRFLVLGCQILIPAAALSCAVMLPLAMTGTYVDNSSSAAGMASIMRYSLSNIEPHSVKLWAPFALSYAVLAWAGYCLYMHYKSYALLRLVYLRFSLPREPDAAPVMAIAGFPPHGWAVARSHLLKLISPYYMMRLDAAFVRRVLESSAAAEAAPEAAAPSGAGAAERPPDAAEQALEATPLLPAKPGAAAEQSNGKGGKDREGGVLPFWLPPERMPAPYSAELGSCTPAGKACSLARKRAAGWTTEGRPVWVPAEQYAVLFQAAGPLPSKELWTLLRPPAPPPSAVSVEGSGGIRERLPEEQDNAAAVLQKAAAVPGKLLGRKGAQRVVEAGELVATQLAEALQELFPTSFASLVRVHNHQAVDSLLVQHDAAAAKRERWAAAAAAAGLHLKALGGGGAGGKVGSGNSGSGSSSGGGITAWRRRRAAQRLARAEAEHARWQQRAAELEQRAEAARQDALARPLGTAFIALFKDQASAAIAASGGLSLVPGVNLTARPAPGPDSINWAALWSTWGQRILRGVAVVPWLAFWLIFPVGVLTGAMTNLSTAVCSGTPDTNSIYWPWYCEQTSLGARIVKSLLQGVLPPIISMSWDTFVLPMVFWAAAASERRHAALSDLDRRIVELFFLFDLFNTFLGAVMGGATFQQIGNLVGTPGYWMQILGAALPAASTFFLNYCIVAALSSNFSRFVWPHAGVCLNAIFIDILRLVRPATERDACMVRAAPSFRPPRCYAKFLLVMIMALSYAVTAPLVLPPAAGFFFTAWIVWRYHCLYFYERQYESGGRLWETAFTLMVWTLATFSIFTALMLAAKRNYTAALIMVFTQLPALLVYHKKVVLSVGHFARHLPLQAALHAPRAAVDPAAYVPPPLRRRAVGWEPEWGKVWSWYGIGRYSL